MTTPPHPQRSKHHRKQLRPAFWVLCIIVASLAAASFLLDKPRSHYPKVTLQSGNDLQMRFLHRPYADATACEMTVSKVVTAIKRVCPACTIVEQRCLQKLNPRQKLLLDGAVVDVPVMRLPSAVLLFEAADPAIAQQICDIYAAQNGGNNTCASPDPATLAIALAATSHRPMQSHLSTTTLAKLTAFAALTSFLICAFIIWSERWHSRFSHDMVNSGPQKLHETPVPRIGGIALASAIAASLLVLHRSELLSTVTASGFALLALSALPAFAGGLAEDLTKKVGVLARLLLTMAAGLLASRLIGATLTQLDVPGIDNLLQHWPWFAIAFTAFAVGGVANSMNIIDGHNGLAGGFAIAALSAFAWLSLQMGDQVVLIASLTMLGAVLGFLFWNWPSGKIFLGDGGAYLLGFWVAELGVLLVVRNPQISPWFPLLVMSYPIWETIYSMYRRRFLQQQSVGQPDNRHFHQLVYRSLKRRLRIAQAPNAATRANRNVMRPMAPWLIVPALIAVLFNDNTGALMAAFATFCVAYLWYYRRLSSGT